MRLLLTLGMMFMFFSVAHRVIAVIGCFFCGRVVTLFAKVGPKFFMGIPWFDFFRRKNSQPQRCGTFFGMKVMVSSASGCWEKSWIKNCVNLENIVYHFSRQLWLVLGVKLMEINSNLFSSKEFLEGLGWNCPRRSTCHPDFPRWRGIHLSFLIWGENRSPKLYRGWIQYCFCSTYDVLGFVCLVGEF